MASDSVIEKNVPPPTARALVKRKYPLFSMAVGDSFLVSDTSPKSVRSAMSYAKKCHAKKGNSWMFTTRTVEGGIRVWRIA